jgi:hypothetical protein
LTLTGSVELTEERPDGALVPAILFPAGGSTFDIVDMRVKGTFPSDFVLDVYDPPPTIPDPPAIMGYITAVPKDHPPKHVYSTFSTLLYSAGCSAIDCGAECPPCDVEAMWCAEDDCYYENRTCPKLDSPIEECTITKMEGDPKLK